MLNRATINRIRNFPLKSGLAYQRYGKSSDIKEYSDREITEMFHGIYKDDAKLLVDGDYFIDLYKVDEIICQLERVSYYKKPTAKDYETNAHNSICNIKTFFIKDYLLNTEIEFNGVTLHRISNFLHHLGAFNQRRDKNGLYSISNDYNSLQSFKDGLFPKDLYHPIKKFINGLFFIDEYFISNFKVESKIRIEKGF